MTQQDDQPDWVVIAQAEGVLSARDRVSITEAAGRLRIMARALGKPVDRVARDVMRPLRARSGARYDRLARSGPALADGLDLDEEVALHEEITRRRGGLPDLDADAESVLRAQLLSSSPRP